MTTDVACALIPAMKRLGVGLVFITFALGCGDDSDTVDAGPVDTGTVPRMDAQASVDATPMDSSTPDAGTPDSGAPDPFPRVSCDDVTGTCVSFSPGEEGELFDAINSLSDDTTIVLGSGTFDLDNAVTIRRANGVTLVGQGIDVTTLDFSSQTTQSNGVDAVGDDFSIGHLTIVDSQKDGLRVENSTNVKIQFVKVTWSGGPDENNGAYGVYPVSSTNVLVEDSEAYNASDAGLYVGQCINVIMRRNVAMQNVAGLEVENTQFADIYENVVEDNAGGLLIFDLPGNPVFGRDIKVHNNTVRNNNRDNFAASGTTVSAIPAGTGTFALASRRLEISNNTYENNDSVDIAILNGLVVESSTDSWAIPIDQVIGSTVGIELVNTGTHLMNFRTTEIYIHDNTHSGSGTAPDAADPDARALGALLGIVYFFPPATGPVDTIVYDGVGETVDPAVAGNNTNNNHICVENEMDATFAMLDIPKLEAMVAMNDLPDTTDIYQPPPPFAPFDCMGFTNGPIPDVVLP